MLILDRRRCRPLPLRDLRAQLSTAQLVKLAEMAKEGWRLDFVRRGPARSASAVLTGRANSRVAVAPDGSVDSSPRLNLRD